MIGIRLVLVACIMSLVGCTDAYRMDLPADSVPKTTGGASADDDTSEGNGGAIPFRGDDACSCSCNPIYFTSVTHCVPCPEDECADSSTGGQGGSSNGNAAGTPTIAGAGGTFDVGTGGIVDTGMGGTVSTGGNTPTGGSETGGNAGAGGTFDVGTGGFPEGGAAGNGGEPNGGTAGSAGAGGTIDTPPPCVVTNAFDDQGCPDDFENSDMDFCFSDDEASGYPQIHSGDGQLMALDEGDTQDCGIMRVKETAYYAIFDTELSESCLDQTDETGYLTVFNSCNKDGWATQPNVGERYIVQDVDNVGEGCESDDECAADRVCRQSTDNGRCCTPNEPIYMGTFLMVAGENILCINHWCPEAMADDSLSSVMINDGCETHPNSIHFKIAATAFLCKQEGYVQPC